ncbi:hypothetical protein NliqN6_0161 [Naganishia liquefaciens]|uniref:Uncharacterized protein n=1 Tax=Naganishia liquefaciens TaxID=104408 RepID=A0A8H3TMV9_9TREE|nr:hypothetical protein NliqN6_0161 [Naganishia liquefaciens]
MPEPRGPRSGGGICPDTGCSGGEGAARFYGDLMEHVRRAHPKKVWSPDDFIGNTSGIVVCECGAPAVSKKGLRQHQGKTGCVGLERFLQNQTASRLPTANEVRQPRRPGRPSPMNSPTGVLSHSDDDVNARIFGQGLRRPREHSEQSMDVVEDPYPASLDPSPGDFSRTSSPLFETQVLTGGPALLPPAPMDVGTDLSDECLPSRLRANFGFEEMKNAFTALASLPTTYRPLPPPITTSFAQAAERVANRFLADASSERAIFEFLCLPKMGLAPGQGTASTARLAKYPDVSAPQISRPSGEFFCLRLFRHGS